MTNSVTLQTSVTSTTEVAAMAMTPTRPKPSGSVSGSVPTQLSSSLVGRDIGVDLGTANTLVYVRGRGIVLNEPSVVAVNTATGTVVAFGTEAKAMIGRTPAHVVAVRPLKDGVIADFELAERMLRYFIQKVHRRRYFAKPRIVVCVPSGITGVERRAVIEAANQAGARAVHIVEEPMAAAIGAGMPVGEATGCMVVDIGGGTTEVAVISLGGIVCAQSIRVAGDDMDEAIISYLKKEFSLLIGERTAEEIKMTIAAALPVGDEFRADVRGRDLVSGLPKNVVISPDDVRRAIDEPVNAIIDAVRGTLDGCPPELAADVMDRGIVLTGGGALLRRLDDRICSETGMPVIVAQRPLECVALGAGRCVDEFEALQSVFASHSQGPYPKRY
jgi:rod shape-determining protein MreB